LISYQPLTGRYHEPEITALILQLACEGFSDYLLDIGTNVGLISLQCGSAFKVVHGFEPNPDLSKVLGVNCQGLNNFTLHPYGIGANDAEVELFVPPHNLGGGFILAGNGYSPQLLAEKDGMTKIDGYQTMLVDVKKGSRVFSELFAGFRAQGLRSGVIKIDVEGFENVILRELAEADRSGLQFAIIFENFDPQFDLGYLRSQLLCSRVMRLSSNLEAVSTPRKIARLLMHGKRVELQDAARMTVGTLVVRL